MSNKKDVSVLAGTPGASMDIIAALVSEVRKCGGTEEDVYGLIAPEEKILVPKIAELIVQEVHNTYRVTVDYNMSLAEMIEAGNYDWRNNDINNINFSTPPEYLRLGKVDVNIELVCCGRYMTKNKVLVDLDSHGKRPGILPELLALGARFPFLQLEYPVVQIGSVWPDRGGLRGTYLRRGKKERGLSVIWLKYGFRGYYRIIAVQK